MSNPLFERPRYIELLSPWMGKPVIKVLTGMRRVGKSSILKLLANAATRKGQDPIYLDMESLEHEGLRSYRPFYDFVKGRCSGGKRLLFVDEVQEIAEWEKAISSLLAEDAADIVITGSNANLLSGELATLLAGRSVSIEVWPLSLAEYDSFRASRGETDEERFERYLRFGGMPGLHWLEADDASLYQYLGAVFSSIVLKDVVGRIGVRDLELFDRIVRFAFDNVGSLVSSKRIADFLKSERRGASVDTIASYLAGLVKAFVLHRTPRWDIKGKRHLQMADKYYSGDVGLRHAVIGYRDADIAGVMENLVYLELRRRGYRVAIGRVGDAEIDFVAEKPGRSAYVQVAYRLDSPETIERELSPFSRLADRYPCALVTLDRYQGRDFEGVRRLYLPDFLRGEEL